MTTAADAIVSTLIGHGVRNVYCLPGVQNDPLFNAFFDAGERIRVVHTRHEQGAAYMALGAALATGQPAVYCVVPGPGLLNTTAALCTAFATNARVLCLAGQIPSGGLGRGRGLPHEIPDQLAIIAQLTKWAARVERPEEGAAKLALAFRAALSGRPRPVGIEVPTDVLAATGEFPAHRVLPPDPDPEADDAGIEAAAALLARAERPMIFVGGGAQDAGAAVRRLAEHLQAPVVAHRMGRGVLDHRHPLSLTVTGAHRLWRDCDVALAVGSRMEAPLRAWGTDARLRLIRIDIDPAELACGTVPAVGLLGDAATVVGRLAEAVALAVPPRPSRAAAMQALKQEVARDLAVLEPQLGYLAAIREVLPEDGIYVDEITQLGYVARVAWPVYRPRSYLTPGYQGTLGWGFAAALGAKHACPDRKVVSVTGDGGFLFCQPELATAVRHRIGLVTIVFNDSAFGNVRRMQQEQYGNRVIGSDLANPDFVRLGESFGVTSRQVRSPAALRATLAQALAAEEPWLIEVPCGPMPSPWPFLNLPRVRGKGTIA